MFRTVPQSIIRSFSLYTEQCYMSYRYADSKHVGHIQLLCVQWKTPDDGQRNCPKPVEFYSKNKFEKSASSWFYYKNLLRCRSLNVTISRCTVTWTSLYHDLGHWTSLYHDVRSPERHYITMQVTERHYITMQATELHYITMQVTERHYITMHVHLNVTISRCR